MKTKALALVIVLALVAAGAFLVDNRRQHNAHGAAPGLLPVVVETRLLANGHTRLTLPVVADVQAVRESVVASRLSAYVVALPLFEGDRFQQGEVLARLDMVPSGQLAQGGSLRADMSAAEATLKSEQERLSRTQALYRIEGVSLEQVQAAEAAFAAARARHAVASENLQAATVRAPFSGVVSQRLAQPGELATPGKPLLKITDTGAGSRLLVSVPETLQPAGVLYKDQLLPLTPWPEGGAQGLRRYEARSLDPDLWPGTRTDVRLVVLRSPKAVLLPHQCLLDDDGHEATALALREGGAVPAPMPAVDRTHQGAAHAAQPPAHEGGAATAAAGVEPLRVRLLAEGTEGAASGDPRLAGRRVACASPDILALLLAGAPFTIQAAGD
jgi:pyruvate/2-oxoglutarate dehydrogenase complex dihydrolipoamide acyltransferase (E2) component